VNPGSRAWFDPRASVTDACTVSGHCGLRRRGCGRTCSDPDRSHAASGACDAVGRPQSILRFADPCHRSSATRRAARPVSSSSRSRRCDELCIRTGSAPSRSPDHRAIRIRSTRQDRNTLLRSRPSATCRLMSVPPRMLVGSDECLADQLGCVHPLPRVAQDRRGRVAGHHAARLR